MGSRFDGADRYLDETGAELSFSNGAAVYLYGIEQPLAPGANTTIRARVTVLSAENNLADYTGEVYLLNSVDRRIGTPVDELPPHTRAQRQGAAGTIQNQPATRRMAAPRACSATPLGRVSRVTR